MFTVVIPLYNKETYIERAVRSVLDQTCTDFELLIVDDGSEDKGPEKVRGMNDDRLRLISKTNGGVSSARNYGIANASRDYIAFLDADDMWSPQFLESVVYLIQHYPKADVFTTNFEIISLDETKKIANKDDTVGYIENYFKSVLNNIVIHSSAVTVHKSVFAKVGTFNEDLTRGEDLDLWWRIGRDCCIAYLPEPRAYYYLDTQNSSLGHTPHPKNSFAYSLDLKMARDKNEYRYLRKLVIRKIGSYLLNSRRLDYFFMMLRKHKLDIIINFRRK